MDIAELMQPLREDPRDVRGRWGHENAGIVTVAALSILPALVFAYRWVIRNNRSHFASEQERADAAELRFRQGIDGGSEAELNERRKEVLGGHGRLQNRLSFWFLIAGYLWLLGVAVS